MTRKRVLIIAILVMTVLAVYCFYYLLFVPHNASQLMAMAREADAVISAEELLTAGTGVVLDQDDVGSLKEIGEEKVYVPLTITVKAETGGNFSHIDKKIEYTVLDEEASSQHEAYYDSDSRTMYIRTQSGWRRRTGATDIIYDIDELLSDAWDNIDAADFGHSDGMYTLSYPASYLGTDVLAPFLRSPDDVEILSGVVVFGFDKNSKTLVSMQSEGVRVCIRALVGTDQEADASSEIDVTAKFSRQNEVPAEEYTIPDDVLNSKSAGDNDGSSKRYIISTDDLAERDKTSYTVGTDLPEGTYYIRHRSGAGIMKVLAGDDATELYTYKSGYNYYKIDGTGSADETELNEGDKIILTGDDYSLILEAK